MSYEIGSTFTLKDISTTIKFSNIPSLVLKKLTPGENVFLMNRRLGKPF
jgi:hypothetical protein